MWNLKDQLKYQTAKTVLQAATMTWKGLLLALDALQAGTFI